MALSPTPAPDLRDVSCEELRKALSVYLEVAYQGATPPEAVTRRLNWPEGRDLATLVSGPPFERASKPGGPPIYALRLGNLRYPHMKLQIQPWPCPAGYMLSVNTHDQILGIDPSSPDAEAFRQLQDENKKLKEEIETAWDQAGLPIFLRYLRDYLDSHPGGV